MKNMRNINRQGGAVAVIVGISIVLLVGFLAMVIDLGHLYIAKTELQNAADAAALAGAKDLDGTVDGVNNAIASAGLFANKNNYDFSSKPVVSDANLTNPTAEIDISVGTCPDPRPVAAGGCMVSVTAGSVTAAQAAGATFLMVYTRNRDMVAWFAPIWNIFHVSTYGMAVAGRYRVKITPLGICAIEEIKRREETSTNELIEFGFRRGVAYNIPDLNPLVGLSQNPYWINPVDVPPACDSFHSSTNFNNPFVCTGQSSVISTLPTEVWINPGVSGALEKALNSRFDDFGGSPCDSTTAPPDTNVREYRCTDTSSPENCDKDRMPTQNYNSINLPKDWMAPSDSTTPTKQAIVIDPVTKVPVTPTDFSTQYGALWSCYRAVHADTSSTPPKPGAPFNANDTDWGLLYGGTINTGTGGYPDPTNTSAAPCKQTSGNKYFLTPPNNPPGTPDRRVLNIAIIDCRYGPIGGGGPCGTRMRVIGIGKFFMTRGAKVSGGSNAQIDGEFAGIIDPFPPADIRLYR